MYRATDTKLDREVALKVLPQAFTEDPDRLTRFEREAKVLASLNHTDIGTNIGHIYGLEEADGQKALVLELIEGPTLADRIAQGPIPIEETDLAPAGETLAGRRGSTLRAFASASAVVGDMDAAFEALDRAFEAHSPVLHFLPVNPLYDPFREDARYGDLVRKMNFPPR